MDTASIIVTAIVTFITTLAGSGAVATHFFNKKIKAIEKENSWKTKLFDDVYNSHKSLWKDLGRLVIPGKMTFASENNENQIQIFQFMYFLRSFDEANKATIEYRDNLYETTLFLNKTIIEDVEFIRDYLNVLIEIIKADKSGIEAPHATYSNRDWASLMSDYTKSFKKDVYPCIIKLQRNVENFTREGILKYEPSQLTDKERQTIEENVNIRLAKTKLFIDNQIFYEREK